MRNALAILTVVVLFSSVAPAQMFYPIQDLAINKAGGEQYASGDLVTQCRVAKYRQHYLLMMYDWAAIEAAGAVWGPNVVYTLSMKSADDRLDGIRARILISSNNTATVVADGNSQFTNFSWTNSTTVPATTSQFAQTYEDAALPGTPDLVQSIGSWPWGDFDGLRNYAGNYNALPLIFGLAGARTEVELEKTWFMPQIFSGTCAAGYTVQGIYTFDLDNAGSNGEGYTSDAGTADSPYILVTPEPASLLLIAVGGIGLLLRKRR